MTSQYHKTGVEELKHLYTLRNEAQIIEFLDANPALYDFLHEAYPIVKSYFPDESLLLELRDDHEDESYQVLFLYINTTREVDPAMDILQKFELEYWVKLPYEIRHPLAVTVSLS